MWRCSLRGHLIAEVQGLHDGPGGDVGDAPAGAVDANGPVRVVAVPHVQHADQLAVARPAVHVPWHRVPARVHLILGHVQACTAHRAGTRPQAAKNEPKQPTTPTAASLSAAPA